VRARRQTLVILFAVILAVATAMVFAMFDPGRFPGRDYGEPIARFLDWRSR